MKLTKCDKEAFVRAVMDDVPTVDYDEQAQKIATEALIAAAPPEVRVVFSKYPEWLSQKYCQMPGVLYNDNLPHPTGYDVIQKEMPKLWSKLDKLAKAKHKQQQALDALKDKLNGIINSCSTLKQAHERLPEFQKYLPQERDGTGVTNLPAISNVVADLVRLGWPKQEEKAAVAA